MITTPLAHSCSSDTAAGCSPGAMAADLVGAPFSCRLHSVAVILSTIPVAVLRGHALHIDAMIPFRLPADVARLTKARAVLIALAELRDTL